MMFCWWALFFPHRAGRFVRENLAGAHSLESLWNLSVYSNRHLLFSDSNVEFHRPQCLYSSFVFKVNWKHGKMFRLKLSGRAFSFYFTISISQNCFLFEISILRWIQKRLTATIYKFEWRECFIDFPSTGSINMKVFLSHQIEKLCKHQYDSECKKQMCN